MLNVSDLPGLNGHRFPRLVFGDDGTATGGAELAVVRLQLSILISRLSLVGYSNHG
jgi:hypothetical protein